ncbi:hypothetical protein ABT56_11795 [Photobacterium aquae]|uniref:Exonuclease n=1 Tax=Photobacterium aquae TaxID=1195763 RepID=A0A0J1JT02_9GAMM|nr:lipid A deacylase LpxR family protein [Photobacterium aquae]KLV05392.1 hypothetical protein ABT56_11795 [Photobacterium aquae]
MNPLTLALAAGSVLFVPCVSAFNAGSFAFSIDNDGIVGTDQNYTNGVFFEYNSASTLSLENDAPIPFAYIANWLPLDENRSKNWNLRLGQQMWTPEDIEANSPPDGERPYAGLLFLEGGIRQFSPLSVDKYNLMIGTVGPNAFAEDTQKFIHSIIGSDDPMGWDTQIDNQLVFNLGYEGHRLLTRDKAWAMDEYDLSGIARINAGNYQSELAVGGVIRWGTQLANNFGTTGFTPGKYVDSSVLANSPSGYFVFTGIEGRYRFNDITIDGDRPTTAPETHVENWQATAIIGAVYYQPSWGVSLSLASSTPEFEEDKHSISTTGSLELFWRF